LAGSYPDGRPALLGVAAADVVLDCVKASDAFERLAGDRRRAGGSELVEAPTDKVGLDRVRADEQVSGEASSFVMLIWAHRESSMAVRDGLSIFENARTNRQIAEQKKSAI
jgi:hypothetical protein